MAGDMAAAHARSATGRRVTGGGAAAAVAMVVVPVVVVGWSCFCVRSLAPGGRVCWLQAGRAAAGAQHASPGAPDSPHLCSPLAGAHRCQEPAQPARICFSREDLRQAHFSILAKCSET